MTNYPVEKKKRIKKLRKELRLAKKNHVQAKQKLKKTRTELARLNQLKSELELVTGKNEGVMIKMANKVPDWVDGIWIVGKREKEGDEDKVTFYKFFEFIREQENYKKLEMNIPRGPMIGVDGIEVTMNKGDMLQIVFRPDIKQGYGFHFANVGPNGEVGQLQLELALHRLGMGAMPCTDPKTFLVVDGSFRKVN